MLVSRKLVLVGRKLVLVSRKLVLVGHSTKPPGNELIKTLVEKTQSDFRLITLTLFHKTSY